MEVLAILGVDPEKGLDRFELDHRREHFGLNRLTEKRARSPLVQFLLQFHQPLVYILLSAAAVTLAFAERVESAVIFGVVLVNAVVDYLQGAKALRAIRALAGSLTSEAAVLRAGRRQRVPSEDLVPGDVVLLQSGDKVPADLRLVAVRDLQVNESALTRESVPTTKEETRLPQDLPLGDRRNMAYSSTLVTNGAAVGMVVATGDATEIGRISELIASTEVLQTTLTKKVHAFSNLLLGVILGLQAMMDPPRPEAAGAVAPCRRAGVRVKMITGDHGVTAAAIARQIGIGEGEAGAPKALSGRDLDGLSDAELIEAADQGRDFHADTDGVTSSSGGVRRGGCRSAAFPVP
jgi:Ca2+-transporting ATPase